MSDHEAAGAAITAFNDAIARHRAAVERLDEIGKVVSRVTNARLATETWKLSTDSVCNSGRDSTRPPGPATDRYRDRSPERVKDHDFRSEAEGLAIPYGIYDPRANAGTVFVGQTADTPAFAVDCIEKWWRTEGRKHYLEANALQILADGGGSNSSTARAWKYNLQHRLCNRHGLRVTVAHYPPATSKWNPIEHRLFCEVTKNWAGRPLDSYETILKYLRTTRTATGVRVRAHLVRKTSRTGVKVTDAQMQELRITPDSSVVSPFD